MENTKIVTLILIDGINEIIIYDLDTNILIQSSKYFKNLLTMFKEQFDDKISIVVPNGCGKIMIDIIMSLHNEPIDTNNFVDESYSMAYAKCCDMFGFQIDPKYFDCLVINDEIFKLVLNTFWLTDYDDSIIKFVIEKIPKEYDLSKLDKKLINKILASCQYKIATTVKYDILLSDALSGILISDPYTSKLITSIYCDDHYIYDVTFSSDNKKIIWTGISNSAKSWCFETSQLFNYGPGARNYSRKVSFLHNDQKIISVNYGCMIKIWDVETHQLITTLIEDQDLENINIEEYREEYGINNFTVSSDETKIASVNNHQDIKIWCRNW